MSVLQLLKFVAVIIATASAIPVPDDVATTLATTSQTTAANIVTAAAESPSFLNIRLKRDADDLVETVGGLLSAFGIGKKQQGWNSARDQQVNQPGRNIPTAQGWDSAGGNMQQGGTGYGNAYNQRPTQQMMGGGSMMGANNYGNNYAVNPGMGYNSAGGYNQQQPGVGMGMAGGYPSNQGYNANQQQQQQFGTGQMMMQPGYSQQQPQQPMGGSSNWVRPGQPTMMNNNGFGGGMNNVQQPMNPDYSMNMMNNRPQPAQAPMMPAMMPNQMMPNQGVQPMMPPRQFGQSAPISSLDEEDGPTAMADLKEYSVDLS